jgi:uncharacterized protein YoaH (UPF0181 family)
VTEEAEGIRRSIDFWDRYSGGPEEFENGGLGGLEHASADVTVEAARRLMVTGMVMPEEDRKRLHEAFQDYWERIREMEAEDAARWRMRRGVASDLVILDEVPLEAE